MKHADSSSASPATHTPAPELPDFLDLMNEILLSAIPYRRKPIKADAQGFYLVCDYWPVPRGTVLLFLAPGAKEIQVHGYLPQGTPAEKAAMREILEINAPQGQLNFAGLLEHRMRVCTERVAVQRLLELSRLLSVARASTNRPQFH